jgi:hypothetical protein
MPALTIETLCSEAAIFAIAESQYPEPSLYGVTDGKKIGTYLEQKFRLYLKDRYEFLEGNSASGIDFPGLLVDMKVTSINQPQSSCPLQICPTQDFWAWILVDYFCLRQSRR